MAMNRVRMLSDGQARKFAALLLRNVEQIDVAEDGSYGEHGREDVVLIHVHAGPGAFTGKGEISRWSWAAIFTAGPRHRLP